MDPAELAARRIAQRGREALEAWLRPVFAEAATRPGSGPRLEPEQLEAMVREAADHADGVLWRRALAEVACHELEIGLGEAAEHPAVRRAQEMLGVPGYRQESSPPPAQPVTAAPDEPRDVRVTAVHLGGIETLRTGARNLELRFSAAGLDVISTPDGETIGRLVWEEITGLELPQRRGLRQRRARSPELIVRTDRGQASFELPGLNDEQVSESLAPMLARVGGARG